MGVAGLRDRALGPGRPEECSEGTRPRYAPMVEPVKRFQSPISTASPKAVSIEIPRRHSGPDHRGIFVPLAAIAVMPRIEAVSAVQRQSPPCLQAGLVGRPAGRGHRSVAGAARLVGVGPGLPAGIDEAVAQQELGDPVPGPHQIRRARPRGHAPDPGRPPGPRPGTRTGVILPEQGQPGQMLGILGIGLHPVSGTGAGASTGPRPAFDPGRSQKPGQARIRWVLLHRQPGPGLVTGLPTRRSRHRWRPGSGAEFSPVSRSIAQPWHTARMDIQTDVGTLVHGWNLQTFKCGSTSPHPHQNAEQTVGRQPTNLFEPGVPVLLQATTTLHIV